MNALIGKQRGRGFLAQIVIFPGGELIQIQEPAFWSLATCRAQSACVPVGRAILPSFQVLRGTSVQTTGVAPFSANPRCIFANTSRKCEPFLRRRLWFPRPCPVRAAGAVVVRAELQDHDVTFNHHRQNRWPFAHIGWRTRAAQRRAVDEIGFVRIEVCRQSISPIPIDHCSHRRARWAPRRIADEKNAGQ